jgi:hypothetical protein
VLATSTQLSPPLERLDLRQLVNLLFWFMNGLSDNGQFWTVQKCRMFRLRACTPEADVSLALPGTPDRWILGTI